jgi:hypothetical protein
MELMIFIVASPRGIFCGRSASVFYDTSPRLDLKFIIPAERNAMLRIRYGWRSISLPRQSFRQYGF